MAALVAAGRALASQHNLYLAMPLFVFDASDPLAPAVNKIVVADPAGQIVLEHVKYGGNLLEGTLPGSRVLQAVETPFGTLSAVICWDTDYPAVLRQASALRVDLLLSPAYVWPEVARIHAEMAPFRSIENGMTLLRQSDGGFSLVSDPYGRVVARQDDLSGSVNMMIVDAPLQSVDTTYAWVGDTVGQVSVGAALLAVLVAVGRRLRRPARTAVHGYIAVLLRSGSPLAQRRRQRRPMRNRRGAANTAATHPTPAQ